MSGSTLSNMRLKPNSKPVSSFGRWSNVPEVGQRGEALGLDEAAHARSPQR
ncbi:hypothetical protein BC739_002627 [Kutzneria viridogrisea]|uniref:Uncharacterized protein n=1 Tax=Kutzneria viridogrisea TaxID=47990 RepID=A0ABR6BEX6_9PSEU|nr:hypothetical protein [Kutzneria viridogrisea]